MTWACVKKQKGGKLEMEHKSWHLPTALIFALLTAFQTIIGPPAMHVASEFLFSNS